MTAATASATATATNECAATITECVTITTNQCATIEECAPDTSHPCIAFQESAAPLNAGTIPEGTAPQAGKACPDACIFYIDEKTPITNECNAILESLSMEEEEEEEPTPQDKPLGTVKLASILAHWLCLIWIEIVGKDAQKFSPYLLGTVYYAFLSDYITKIMDKHLRTSGQTYAEAYSHESERPALEKWSLEHLGFFINPETSFRELVRKIVSPQDENDRFSFADYERATSSVLMRVAGEGDKLKSEVFNIILELKRDQFKHQNGEPPLDIKAALHRKLAQERKESSASKDIPVELLEKFIVFFGRLEFTPEKYSPQMLPLILIFLKRHIKRLG